MSVQLVLGNIESRIVGVLPDYVHDALEKSLSFKKKGVEHSERVKNGLWDGYIRLYKRGRQSYLTGLQSIVAEILKENNIAYVRNDMRIRPQANLQLLDFNPPSRYEERDYQQVTIERSLNATRGILKVATGGGKTMIVTELIGKIKTGPFMFYVLTKDLLDQAHDTLSTCLNVPIGKIGGGECDIQMINVCTIQTAIRAINMDKKIDIRDYSFDEEDLELWKEKDLDSFDKLSSIRKVISSCKGLYFDETHHAAANTCRDVINASPNAFWKYGGSATPYREDGAELMLQALLGKKIVDINASYLINRGFLVEPTIVFEPIHHDIHLHSWKSIYKNCVAKNDLFNRHVADTAKFLMEKGMSTLVLVGQIQQGEFIKSLLPNIPFVSHKTNKKLRQTSIQDLRDKKVLGMIATSLADEGLDIPTLNTVLLAGGGASATRVNQRIGRALRLDKNSPRKKSIVIYYEHDARYLSTHAIRARNILKKEPKFNIVKSAGKDAINQEIERIMGISESQRTLFD